MASGRPGVRQNSMSTAETRKSPGRAGARCWEDLHQCGHGDSWTVSRPGEQCSPLFPEPAPPITGQSPRQRVHGCRKARPLLNPGHQELETRDSPRIQYAVRSGAPPAVLRQCRPRTFFLPTSASRPFPAETGNHTLQLPWDFPPTSQQTQKNMGGFSFSFPFLYLILFLEG